MIPIDQQLLMSVMKQESGGDPNALSPKGAAGIMQIMPDTARDPGYGVTPLRGWDGVDPRTAPVAEQIRFGNDYLNAMKAHHGGNTQLALAAYNAGPGAVQKYGGIPPYQETQNYVQKVSQMANQSPQQLNIQWDEDPIQQGPQLDIQWDEPNTLGQKLQSNIQNRQAQMQQAADAYVAGEQSYPETAAQQGLSFAMTVPDMLLSTAGHFTPQIVKDVGGKALEAGTFLAANTVGNLPVGFGGEGKLRDNLPQELARISEGNTRLDRNVRAVGQAVGLVPTAKALDLLGEGSIAVGKKVANNPVVKDYLADTTTTQGIRVANKAEKVAQKTAADMGQLAKESYDEAAYLGAKFSPDQVSNKLDMKLTQLKPKPLPNGKFTTEDLELAKHIDELTGHKGKQLSLDDIQRLDETLGQKINKFVDSKTGELDANGRKLYLLQKDLRNIVDEADTAGNNALINGRNFYRAKMMMDDLDRAAERAAMNTSNPGRALQAEYKRLYLDKDRTKNWPEDVRAALKRAAEPNGLDEAVDFFGSRLPAIIGFGSGNLPMAATAHIAGMASRGAKEAMIAGRGAKVQQAIVNDTMKKVRPVDIPEPTIGERLLLPAPDKMPTAPMTDTQIKQAQRSMNRPVQPGPDLSGGATKPPVSRMTNLRETLGKGKGREFEGAIQYFEQGSQSQNQFVKDMVKKFGLTQTQARQLAKEVKQYGTKSGVNKTIPKEAIDLDTGEVFDIGDWETYRKNLLKDNPGSTLKYNKDGSIDILDADGNPYGKLK